MIVGNVATEVTAKTAVSKVDPNINHCVFKLHGKLIREREREREGGGGEGGGGGAGKRERERDVERGGREAWT